ncbi:MAG: hypothetical protein KDC83_00510 [Flavobacteriales bacterium]|nr:hypothetical protein [Flavobacteriales bacterium]
MNPYITSATLVILSILVVDIPCLGQEKTKAKSKSGEVVFHINHGKLQGEYKSFYKGGQLKATGVFKSNCRTGKWIIYNETGQKKVERDYSSPLHFSQILPVKKDDAYLQSVFQMNPDGYVEYPKIDEKNILWSKRIWRTIDKKDNPLLFNDEYLYKTLYSGVIQKQIQAYAPRNDEFADSLLELHDELKSIQVTAFKIKEEYYFDQSLNMMLSQIIGICPVSNGTDLFWLYYPNIQPYLAQMAVVTNLEGVEVKSLDQLFEQRMFASTIYQESNTFDLSLAEMHGADKVEEQSLIIELDLIETEHDFWLKSNN